jgi:hypothetical protein
MAVSCGRRIQVLWCNEQRSNAWVWIENAGWRKLDDRHDDACTNLLAIAAEAKSRHALVSIAEVMRDGIWVITEIYDFNTGLTHAAQEVSFAVSECIYGWTARFRQEGTNIRVRIRLAPDEDVTADELDELKERWKRGIEEKWSYRFLCCTRPDCDNRCALTFTVDWVDEGEHHRVRVRRGPERSNMTTWDTEDTGDVASHEFGHMLGHPDEYEDDNCPDRSPVNTGTVMDDNTEVVERLCEPFCDRLAQDTDPV